MKALNLYLKINLLNSITNKKHIYFFCLGLFYIVCDSNLYGQTTIVGIKTGNNIFIGADSKVVNIDTSNFSNKCKIYIVGNDAFAFAGHPIMNVDSFEFNSFEIANKTFNANCTCEKNVTALSGNLKIGLNNIIKMIKIKNTDIFKNAFPDSMIVLGCLIGCFNNNTPSIYKITYRIFTSIDKPFEISSVIEKDTSVSTYDDVKLFFIGHAEAIVDSIKRNPNFVNNFNEIESIKSWIILESMANPDVVGLPIDIIKITKDGIKWIENNNCK